MSNQLDFQYQRLSIDTQKSFIDLVNKMLVGKRCPVVTQDDSDRLIFFKYVRIETVAVNEQLKTVDLHDVSNIIQLAVWHPNSNSGDICECARVGFQLSIDNTGRKLTLWHEQRFPSNIWRRTQKTIFLTPID